MENGKKKKILLISPHFYPENFKCNDVAFELARRDHDVIVLSDIPNYPGGKFFKGYGVFSKRKETVNGVKIIRTLMIPRGDGSGKRLALNYMSFALTASLRAIWMGLFSRWDAVLVHETSPVTVGIPAVIIRKMQKKCKMLFWVLDLWPESLQAAGGINNKKILGMFGRITKWIYRHSDRILISSKGFRKSICDKGAFADKLVYFPNWSEEALTLDSNYELPILPDGFKVMFAGNIGEAQDFDNTLEAFRIIHSLRQDIHLVLVGDGRKRAWVENYVKEHHLENTVHWVGRHPLEAMGKFFEQADVLYFALKDSMIFNLTCPAKLQAYMNTGKPVLAMLNGEGASIVKEAGCGLYVNAGDSESLANTIIEMASMTSEQLSAMGTSGQRYCKEHFSFEHNMSQLESLL